MRTNLFICSGITGGRISIRRCIPKTKKIKTRPDSSGILFMPLAAILKVVCKECFRFRLFFRRVCEENCCSLLQLPANWDSLSKKPVWLSVLRVWEISIGVIVTEAPWSTVIFSEKPMYIGTHTCMKLFQTAIMVNRSSEVAAQKFVCFPTACMSVLFRMNIKSRHTVRRKTSSSSGKATLGSAKAIGEFLSGFKRFISMLDFVDVNWWRR